jgi:hypothetical protein
MSAIFEIMCSQSRSYGETNDCTVKAVAIVTHSTYDDAWAELARRGRRPGRGANQGQWLPAVKNLGHNYVEVTGHYQSKTIRTLAKELPKGERFLVTVQGHLLAFDGETIADWTRGRLHRVKQIWHVAKFKKDLMKKKGKEFVPFNERPKSELKDIVFYWYHEEKMEYRIYLREAGKVRWLNTKYYADDAHDAAYRTAWKRMVGFEHELNPKEVEQD